MNIEQPCTCRPTDQPTDRPTGRRRRCHPFQSFVPFLSSFPLPRLIPIPFSRFPMISNTNSSIIHNPKQNRTCTVKFSAIEQGRELQTVRREERSEHDENYSLKITLTNRRSIVYAIMRWPRGFSIVHNRVCISMHTATNPRSLIDVQLKIIDDNNESMFRYG